MQQKNSAILKEVKTHFNNSFVFNEGFKKVTI